MPYKYKLTEMSKTASPEEAEKELTRKDGEPFAVGQVTYGPDGTTKSTIRDIKLTCLLNCSEDNYTGGDLSLFRDGEVKIDKFEPGSAIIFPSFTNHKVDKIISGSRATLAIWVDGPKFR